VLSKQSDEIKRIQNKKLNRKNSNSLPSLKNDYSPGRKKAPDYQDLLKFGSDIMLNDFIPGKGKS